MTAAIAHSLPTAFRFARTRARARLEHIALVLGICLPVPLLAVTGLSIPLPSSVERLAAALVPWAETSNLDASGAGGASGSIIRTPGEGGTNSSRQQSSSRSSLDPRASASAAPGDKPAASAPGAPAEGTRPGVTPDDKTAPADTTTPGDNRGEASSGGTADSPVQAPVERPDVRQETPPPALQPPPPPPPPPPGVAPPPPPPPITGIVDDTTRPIVDDVGRTVDNVTAPVIGVKPVEAVKGVIPIGKK
jgi:hypothetical protein